MLEMGGQGALPSATSMLVLEHGALGSACSLFATQTTTHHHFLSPLFLGVINGNKLDLPKAFV